MHREIHVTSQSYTALLYLLDTYRNQGAESFAAPFRAHCQRYGWEWFGLEPKPIFRFHAVSLLAAYSHAEHMRVEIARLHDFSPGWWVFHSGSDCAVGERGFDGLALSPTHEFWTLLMPPHGWRCACYVSRASEVSMVNRLGGSLDKRLPRGWDRIDPESGLPPGVEEPWGGAEPPTLALLLAAIADGHSPKPNFG